MEHPERFWSYVALAAIVIIWNFLQRKDVHISTEDCLRVLSFVEWKSFAVIKSELEEYHHGLIDPEDLRVKLELLVNRGYVEHSVPDDNSVQSAEYKKKTKKQKRPEWRSIEPTPAPCFQPA